MALAVGKKRAGDNVAGAIAKSAKRVMETRWNNEEPFGEKVEVFKRGDTRAHRGV
jgi:hypothetical protein